MKSRRSVRTIFLLSATAMGFQGYIMADCSFQDAHGFGFVSNGYPTGPSTLAQGYLAVARWSN